ncbi:hypothetical protein RV11_GL003156 [Enterococcus phoeniculicola]|nr:hypothetical protein RV11_GL003156 [Enterococcus phoeniculicola]
MYLVDEAPANLDTKNAEQIREIFFILDVPFIEVAHHFNSENAKYTHQFELLDGNLVLRTGE